MDDMYELILDSSEHTGVLSEKDRNSADGRDVGPVLARGYIDMVPLNCFMMNRLRMLRADSYIMTRNFIGRIARRRL